MSHRGLAALARTRTIARVCEQIKDLVGRERDLQLLDQRLALTAAGLATHEGDQRRRMLDLLPDHEVAIARLAHRVVVRRDAVLVHRLPTSQTPIVLPDAARLGALAGTRERYVAVPHVRRAGAAS